MDTIMETPQATPDIEKLRKQIRATPSVTPATGDFRYKPRVEVRGAANPWGASLAYMDLHYELRALNSAVSFSPESGDYKTIRIMFNKKGRERFPLHPGRYHISGEFWLIRNPSEKISVDLGEHNFPAHTSFEMIFDRELERAVLYEMELKRLNRAKKLRQERRKMIP